MENSEYFKDISYKIDEEDGHVFKKMHVRVREQIVNLSLEDDVDPLKLTGTYLNLHSSLSSYRGRRLSIDARRL